MAESGESRRRSGLLIAISGAQPQVLEQCPTERIKFQSLGWAILITCGLATLSMWFALTSAMGFNAVMSFPIAVVWGLIIMGIDRWLVTSMPLDGKRKFLIAAPRLALAILLGSLISTPIVLRIFQSEINNQISVIKETSEATFLSSQQHSSVQARVTQWQNTVNNLQAVIVSKGAKPINPASDPVVQGLTTQLDNERKTAASDYTAWQCQLYGGCGAPKGNGPLAQASQARYENDEAQITSLTNEITARERVLQASDSSSQQSRLQQATAALPAAQAQLAAAQAEENSLLNNFQATNGARQRPADPAEGARPALGGQLHAADRAYPAVPAVPGHRDTSGDGEAAAAAGQLREDPAQGDRERAERPQWEMRSRGQRPGHPECPTARTGRVRPLDDSGFDRRWRRRSRDPLDAELERCGTPRWSRWVAGRTGHIPATSPGPTTSPVRTGSTTSCVGCRTPGP